ncbi:hypothetical protein FDECE_14364 [Fusarium decemcellulare]|nr:hypothetical protein FDECE_14364 [Fusarium decemcellulare]
MTSPTTGGCSCGNLKYSFDGQPAAIVSALRSFVMLPSPGAVPGPLSDDGLGFMPLHIMSPVIQLGLLDVTVGARAGIPPAGRDSKSLLPSGKNAPGLVFIKTGSLDDLSLPDTKFRLRAEVYCRNKYSWLSAIDGAAAFDGAVPA